jgi:hypothetical protein
MVELLYGAKNFARVADQEIREGRAVAVRISGWRRPFIYRTLSMYAEYDQVARTGSIPRRLSLGLVWRILLAPSLIGLIHQARSSGMGMVVRDTGTILEVRFEPSNPTIERDARKSGARPSL